MKKTIKGTSPYGHEGFGVKLKFKIGENMTNNFEKIPGDTKELKKEIKQLRAQNKFLKRGLQAILEKVKAHLDE